MSAQASPRSLSLPKLGTQGCVGQKREEAIDYDFKNTQKYRVIELKN